MPKWFDWVFPIVGYGFFGLVTLIGLILMLASPFVVSVSVPLDQAVLLVGLVIFLHGATFCSLIGIGNRLNALEIEQEEGAA